MKAGLFPTLRDHTLLLAFSRINGNTSSTATGHAGSDVRERRSPASTSPWPRFASVGLSLSAWIWLVIFIPHPL